LENLKVGERPKGAGGEHVSGFVAIVGRPNVGKSSLVNYFVGQKIAIVSDKPQTTRNRIQCILTTRNAQVVFLDTPGLHKPQHRLGEYMMQVALAAWEGVDCIIFLVDGAAGIGKGDHYIVERLREVRTPVILAVNKIDRMDRDSILETLAVCGQLGDFHAYFPVSALTGHNVPELLDVIIGLMPPGPRYFPEDVITDHPEEFVIEELVREKVLLHTWHEVPHSVAVHVEEVEKRPEEDLVRVLATIYVEREAQKGIIIGRQGGMLKRIGSEARLEIEALLGSRIYLELHVKVSEGWRDRPGTLRRLGYA
jgi:GTP-binding protein Era